MPPATPAPPSLATLAAEVQGTVEGDGSRLIEGVCSLDEPRPNCLAFVRDGRALRKSPALAALGALLVPTTFDAAVLSAPHPALIRVPDPIGAFARLLPRFHPPILPAAGVSPRAEVHASARLGRNVSVGAFAVVGADVTVGEDSILHPHVVVYPGVRIGARCILHAGAIIREGCVLGDDLVIQNGAVIGADGFGYTPDPQIGLRTIPQVGIVELGNRVDVGANTCIDRATLGATRIGQGTKIDNLVQIGHNNQIGTWSIICGQAGLAGSSKIGNRVTIGGAAGIADHLHIADNVRLAARSGVTSSIPEAGDYGGFPAQPLRQWHRTVAAIRALIHPRRSRSGA